MDRIAQYYAICRIRPPHQKGMPVYDLPREARRTGAYEPLDRSGPPAVVGGCACLAFTD